ncbi:MAG TPA: sulfotransferase [Rhizomicrobium sp.]
MNSLNRFFTVLDGMAASLGLGNVRLDADALIAAALRRAGRSEFSDTSFVPALRLLLDAYEREASLNVFGRHAAKWDALRCLSNLLRFEVEEEKDGAILRAPIERPVFITGFPRSGTTLLHSLLAEDPSLMIPRVWQTIAPYPAHGRDTREQSVDRQLRIFQRLAPEMVSLHPMAANSPQECTEITAQVFQSVRYEATHRVPAYQSWLDAHGHTDAYRFHKRFLQHLQHQKCGELWVLKCPDHLHALNAIDVVYPDARMIFVHRDPLRVIASAAKLTEVLRRPFTRKIDKPEIGRQVVGRVVESADAMVARAKASSAERVFHLHHAVFAADPVGTMESVYRYFGVPLAPDVRQGIRAHLARAGSTDNRYSFEEFGIDTAELCTRFEPYMNQFGVKRECAAWEDARARIAA